jgi:hypothetical protein
MARGIVWIPTTPRNVTPALSKKEFGAADPFILLEREALMELHLILHLKERKLETTGTCLTAEFSHIGWN